ncbi:MAG: N-acetylmuramoyl-L-alanine amidase CwlD [Clostridiales bacterium]|nr:N-acetylmuramoyl-L-alanine amidase CwlD [Clostridiales bacterium]
MKQTIHNFVIKRTARMRMCVLLLLSTLAICMLAGVGGTSDAGTSPAEAQGDWSKALSGLIVALDPGHGGYDGGARAKDSGIWEKDLTLQITLAVEKVLISRGATVVVTRREDVCLAEGDTTTKARKRKDLQRRVDIALEANADVFLSIHLNEYRSRSESGPHVFYQQGGDDGRLLAGVLQEAMISELRPIKERVAMAGNYYVLRSKIPSALVECGFLSNAAEEKLLLTPAYHEKIGISIANGLTEYRKLIAGIGGELGEAGELSQTP